MARSVNSSISSEHQPEVESILNLTLVSYNFLTFASFLITFYLKSFLNTYYCTLTSLERWNLSFLSGSSNTSLSNRYFWRKLLVYASFFVYVAFICTCTGYTIAKYRKWSILILPFFYFFALIWLLFQVLNIINLNNLLNKISDCYLLLNESNSGLDGGGKSKMSHHRASSLSRQSSTNLNNNNNLHSCSTSSSTSSHLSSSKSSSTKNKSRVLQTLRRFLRSFLEYNSRSSGRVAINDDDNNANNAVNSAAAASNNNIPIHRILSYKGVRHLGSISYRICIYCLIQTMALTFFVVLTQSSVVIILFLCIVNINFIWLSLLYQFSKNRNGTCIAYALVAPPLILNVFTNNAANTLNSYSTTMSSKRYKTAQSTMTTSSSGTYATNSSAGAATVNSATTTSGVSSASGANTTLPFNYQQALTQRCNYILSKIQLFLQYHLIENYGCDFAANGLNKSSLETKLRAFFKKRTAPESNSPYYNTYLLYYCGPTSPLTDSLAFIDGNELSIEDICNYWKEVHCADSSPIEVKVIDPSQEQPITPTPVNATTNNNSRLIILLDAEHTTKSIDYIKSKLVGSNIYIALQTVKYSYNNGQVASKRATARKQIVRDNAENKLISSGKKRGGGGGVHGPPGSPQTLNTAFYDTYLNIGKFTLDWIRTNSNALLTGGGGAADESAMNFENFQLNTLAANRYDDLNEDDDEDMDEEDSDMNSENDNSSVENQPTGNVATTVVAGGQQAVDFDLNNAAETDELNEKTLRSPLAEPGEGQHHQRRSNPARGFFYEAKCAFSKYWIDYTFDSINPSQLSSDLVQFWNLYYPYMIFRPLLQLINCRLFYLKFDFLRKILFYLRHIKSKIIPVQEYDTGHGFKLFSS